MLRVSVLHLLHWLFITADVSFVAAVRYNLPLPSKKVERVVTNTAEAFYVDERACCPPGEVCGLTTTFRACDCPVLIFTFGKDIKAILGKRQQCGACHILLRNSVDRMARWHKKQYEVGSNYEFSPQEIPLLRKAVTSTKGRDWYRSPVSLASVCTYCLVLWWFLRCLLPQEEKVHAARVHEQEASKARITELNETVKHLEERISTLEKETVDFSSAYSGADKKLAELKAQLNTQTVWFWSVEHIVWACA